MRWEQKWVEANSIKKARTIATLGTRPGFNLPNLTDPPLIYKWVPVPDNQEELEALERNEIEIPNSLEQSVSLDDDEMLQNENEATMNENDISLEENPIEEGES